MRGDFGLKDARIIAPGDPFRSVLYYRMAKSGSGRMPHLCSEIPDHHGLQMIEEWITSLDPKSGRDSPSDNLNEIDAKLKSIPKALELSRTVRSGALARSVCDQILTKAAAVSDPNVRDLFEYLQPPERRRPTLGANPNAAAILAMKGDAVRGRDLFWNKAALQCKTCHRIGGEGTSLGPELTKIASQRTRAELLDNLLRPSAKLEPAFTSYVLQTKDGVTATGLLVKCDSKEVVLKDAKNQEMRIPTANIERLQPSKTSLMPDGLLKDLTAQEAADLLEFLAGLK
jgi:putative heme-binding domain-containing protein